MENSSSAKGRRRQFSAAQRQEFVALYRQSGLTQVEFARQHGIKVCTFHQWLRRRKQPKGSTRTVFQELVLSPPINTPAWSTEILLGREITVRFGANVPATFMTELVNSLRPSC